MMGRQAAPEQLFYRFRIEDHVPADHLLRKIDWRLDFDSLRPAFAALYSHTGRPSVDPELMIRMLLVGYLYGIRSERHDFKPDRIAADKAYGAGRFLAWLLSREITPHVPVLDRQRQTGGKLGQSHFEYGAERDRYLCPAGKALTRRSANRRTRTIHYRAPASVCGACDLRKACIASNVRTIARHMDEGARETARKLRHTAAFDDSRRRRKKVEMLFAHLKRRLKVTRLRLRGIKRANEEFLLGAGQPPHRI